PVLRAPPPAAPTTSLHDALPIWLGVPAEHDEHDTYRKQQEAGQSPHRTELTDDKTRQHERDKHPEHQGAELQAAPAVDLFAREIDRKSTRLNSSHVKSSYAAFGL